MITYIYGLCKNSKEIHSIKYVGQTFNPKKRLKDHFTKRKIGEGFYYFIILEILDEEDEFVIEAKEFEWITRLKKQGLKLINNRIAPTNLNPKSLVLRPNMQPKHSLKTASIVFRSLFPEDKIALRNKPLLSVYFNGENTPRYSGQEWSTLVNLAIDDVVAAKLSQLTVQ